MNYTYIDGANNTFFTDKILKMQDIGIDLDYHIFCNIADIAMIVVHSQEYKIQKLQ
jgi:hypothetical protein